MKNWKCPECKDVKESADQVVMKICLPCQCKMIEVQLNEREVNKMAKLKEAAEAYEPKKTKNIADLEAVSVEQEIKTETRKNKDDEDYTISFIVVDGEEYRIPNSVLEQLQTILSEKPDTKTIKVTKKGEGLNTSYTVITLE